MSERRTGDMAAIDALMSEAGGKGHFDKSGSYIVDDPVKKMAASPAVPQLTEVMPPVIVIEEKEQPAAAPDEQQVILDGRQQARGFQGVISGTQQVAQSFGGKLSGVPIPGELITPFFIWLVLFMLLAKVNGKSRLGWVWEVMTGNASISGSQAVTVTTGTGSGPDMQAGTGGIAASAPTTAIIPPAFLNTAYSWEEDY